MDSASSELFCWSMAVFFFPCPPGQPAPKKVLQLFIDRWWAAFIGRGRKGRRGAGPGGQRSGMHGGKVGRNRSRASGEARRSGEEGGGGGEGEGEGNEERDGGLQAKATVSVRGRVYGVYAQNGITSCGVGLMSGSVSGGRAADRRDGRSMYYVCEYHHAPQNVVTLHSFQDGWACVCTMYFVVRLCRSA